MDNIIEIGLHISGTFWEILCDMAPYLLLGFAIAGIIGVYLSPKTVETHLGKGRVWPVLKASLLGVPLPLCSCAVLPVATSLRKSNASKGATAAFLLSTPQTGVDSIIVTYRMLGPVFAIFRPIVALISGIVGGLLVSIFDIDVSSQNSEEVSSAESECKCHCENKEQGSKLARVVHHGFVTLIDDMSMPLIIGLIVAGIIEVIVPSDIIHASMGKGIWSIFLMMIAGMPLYVCATGSVPIAAVLLMKGADPGAVLAFLISGPATNGAALATIWRILGSKASIIYLTVVAMTAVISGLVMNVFYNSVPKPVMDEMHSGLPRIIRIISGVVLLTLLLKAVLKNFISKHNDKTS